MSKFNKNFSQYCNLQYKDAIDLLSLTFIIYNYNGVKNNKQLENFSNSESHDINEYDNVTNFTNRLVKNDLSDYSENKMDALNHILTTMSDGIVKKFISDSKTDLQAGITTSDKNKRINIIFRGSESSYDWFYDLNFFKICIDKKNNICVHNGFYNQLTINDNHIKLINEIKKLLQEYPDYSIFISGHSLGGALATLFGYLLSKEISHNIFIISFASPRVGNYNWYQHFMNQPNLIHYRIINSHDIVTAFPSILYYHVGQAIRINSKGEVKILEKDYSWWECSILNCYSPSDHYCDEYYKNLSKIK